MNRTPMIVRPFRRIRHRFRQLLLGRTPPAREVTLNQRRIYIIPSLAGLIWLMVALLLFLMAVNYANSLVFAVSFFMVSLFMLAILHTWRNLAGITVRCQGGTSAHADQFLKVKLEVDGEGCERIALSVGWPDNETVDLDVHGSAPVELRVTGVRRGWLTPGLLRIESLYPLGLCKTWSWLSLDLGLAVYPSIDDRFPLPETSSTDGDRTGPTSAGQEEYAGVRRYQAGDLSGHVDWKGYARRHELNTKVFDQPAGQECMLSLSSAPGVGLEQKLSVLTAWCLECERQRRPFGLSLPGIVIEPDSGQQHLRHCLQQLALYLTEPGSHYG